MVEGYGHYLNEARALFSVILTVDAAPMNELVTPDSGILIPYDKKIARKNGSFMYSINENILFNGIQKLLSLSKDDMMRLGNNAQFKYKQDTLYFEKKMELICKKIIESL